MPIRLAVVNDPRYAAQPDPQSPGRRGELADVLLLRAVHRFNRFIRPDAVVVLGRLVDDPRAPEAPELAARLHEILSLLAMPWFGNFDDAFADLRENRHSGALSGYGRRGDGDWAPRALCEAPFPYGLIDVADDGGVEIAVETLALDPALALVDCHTHTDLAYCNEDMAIPDTARLAAVFGLAGVGVSEHSGALYFNPRDYGGAAGGRVYLLGLDGRREPSRVAEYFARFHGESTEASLTPALGMEVDFDRFGKPVIERDVWDKLDFRLGAIHALSTLLPGAQAPEAEAREEFLFMASAVARSGVDALAHPFRVFRRAPGGGRPVPPELFEPTARLLRRHGVAAEINFHTNEPEPEFFRLCLDMGVRIVFGSDAHNRYEVGEFYPHLRFLEAVAPGAASDAARTFRRLPGAGKAR